MFNLVRISIFWSKSNPGTWKRIELKNSEQTLGARCQIFIQFSKIRKMRIQKSSNLMIFGPIACFRRSGSRFSGQNKPRSLEMTIYIGITGHIKNHENFKIWFWSRESKHRFLRLFRNLFTKKWAGNLGITSETTWESRVRRPGKLRFRCFRLRNVEGFWKPST